MIIENLTIENFLAVVISFPFLIFFTLIVWDGIGIFRDIFRTSGRRRR